MNRRILGIILMVILLGVIVIFFSKSGSTNREVLLNGDSTNAVPIMESNTPETIATNSAYAQMEARKIAEYQSLHSTFSGPYPPWHGGRATSLDDPRWAIRRERQKKDYYWEGKMPIDFYGKVIDEKNQPIAEATVYFSWTDLSPAGSTQRKTLSDANGHFSLRGVMGKGLIVEVTKEGYDRSLQDRFGFEFASFSDEQYYEADPNKPVVFHLRKKGAGEPLIYWEKELKVAVQNPIKIPIFKETQMQFALLSNVYPTQGKWAAQVIIQNGGLIPATDEFLVEAPASGFQSSLDLTPQTPKPPKWQMGQGGAFYLKAGQNYGRLDIEMEPGNDWFHIKVWVNPQVGSRNIEDNGNKLITPDRVQEVGLEKAIEEVKSR